MRKRSGVWEKTVERLADTKFVLVLTGITTAVFIVFAFAYFILTQSSMKTEFIETTGSAICRVGENVSNMLVSAEMISETVFVNDMVQTALTEVGERRGHLSEYRELTSFAESLEYNRNIRVVLYVPDEKMYAADRLHFYPISEAVAEPWYSAVVSEEGRGLWTDGGMSMVGPVNEEVPVFSFVRLIKNRSDFRSGIGVVRVDVPASDITDFMGSVIIEGGSLVHLINDEGVSVISSDGNMQSSGLFTAEEMKTYFTESHGSFERKVDGEKRTVIYCRLSDMDWYVAADIPNKDVASYKTFMYTISVFSVMFALLIIFGILFVFLVYSRFINNKFQEMTGRINIENIETMSAPKHEKRGELYILEERINDAIVHIGRLTRAYYDAKLREEKALMTALQAQINPHFLYNTLDAINWVAIKNNNFEISSMISLLARYFRLSLGMGKNIVTLGNEIELIKVYVSIQQFRFKNRIDVEYNIKPELYGYSVPKMTLQPIVENAIIHGICRERVTNGRINITVVKENDRLYISVRDDGGGADEERINESILYGSRESDRCVKSGYGLHNVYERVMLFSDNDEGCGIKASAAEDETEITVIIKAKECS
ncbi:MAG TPA: sensor histidine kinase [Candidatus Ornithomonoglobus intestinigallinarum]|uniref:Sensor histidine kinase n=1 Tax=Candidatus Ornithomonoglobus intestinigallinarum TaxID=2840894 RepID=A0A9D1KQY8_9FIRM|nr:sensor histidine kinase [Candidatus Ornithomonoglobus intestinigallinarum]